MAISLTDTAAERVLSHLKKRGAGLGLRLGVTQTGCSGYSYIINYADEIDKCVCTHCGNYPKSFLGTTPEISELDVLGETIGREKCFGAVKGKVQSGPMTYFRVSSDDRAGTLKCYLGEGEFTDDPFPMDGGIAVTKVDRLRQLMRFVTRNGFEHHVAMVRGHNADVVNEAVFRYLRWPIYHHGGEIEPSLTVPNRF